MRNIIFVFTLLLALSRLGASAQIDSAAVAAKVDSCIALFFNNYQCDFRPSTPMGYDRSVLNDSLRTLDVYVKDGFAGQVFTPEKVSSAYEQLRACLPEPYNNYNVRLIGFGREISEFVPNIYRSVKDTSRLWPAHKNVGGEWTRNISRPIDVRRGLQGVHLTVWPSHGRYFDHAKGVWRWQRPNLWCTTEDMFTFSIVVPYLLPMLERAGAVVYCPRERDWHTEEMIGRIAADSAAFYPDLSAAGDYAVYVRYPFADNAAADALYTVRHGGVETHIRVNQQIGGGVWVYIGNFYFTEGQSSANAVSLSGATNSGGVVLPSEVRIGGGFGSIERGGQLSGLPRFLEGSRYFAEYSGFPQAVYDTKDGFNDYADDINSRSNMVNWLAGGSPYLPDTIGLRVPMELSLAVHSDAGYFKDNRPFGTLTIYTINGDNGADTLRSGVNRMANSDLASLIQVDVCRDLSAAIKCDWQRRSIFNRDYSESRKPEIPSAIIETMSHQNFQDMIYGHDPNFKRILARSIYKSITRFVASQHAHDYIIQPLPVTHFRADAMNGKVRLSWRAQADSLEPSAIPSAFIVYTAQENEDFDNGVVINAHDVTVNDLGAGENGHENVYFVDVEANKLYRFKVTACNDGGESEDSEILTTLCASNAEENVLVVNGFTRLSSPAVIDSDKNGDNLLGFDINTDIGVPYINTAEYCGAQIEFNRKNIGKEGEGGLGFSGSELEGRVIAGNNFDYPYIHAIAMRSDDDVRSISSCSMDAFVDGEAANADYALIDIVFGLQKDDGLSSIVEYKTFTPKLRTLLTDYLKRGGNVIASGAYLGCDMSDADERKFVATTFGYRHERSISEHNLSIGATNFSLVHEWNPYRYAVQFTDVLDPTKGGEVFAKYESGECAAVSTDNTVVLGFPLEAVNDADDRRVIMNRIIQKLIHKF